MRAAADRPIAELSGDWTAELWFKDEHPNGFNHDYLTLLNKGDRQVSGEAPLPDLSQVVDTILLRMRQLARAQAG